MNPWRGRKTEQPRALASPRYDRQGSSVNTVNKAVNVEGDYNVVEVKHSVQVNESHECA
jgi:hypothetical protein